MNSEPSSAPDEMRPSSILGLVLFAFVLRVLFLVLADVNAPLTGDELAYQQIAENVAAGRGFWQDNNPFFPGQVLYAWQAPLYPLTLGALYKIFGVNIFLAKFFGVLVSTATVYVMYSLTFHVSRFAPLPLRSSRLSLFSALLIAIYPGFLTNAHLLLSETLFIFLILLAFDCVARAVSFRPATPFVAGRTLDSANTEISHLVRNDITRAWLWIFGAGALWGMATLTRGITLYFTPLFALWLAWAMWRESMSRALGAAILFVAATMVVIAPWTLRNYFQFGQIVVVETKGGVNLWLGNSPYTPNDFIRNVWKVGVREPMLENLPTDELQRDRAAYALALDFIRAEPLTFFARMPGKFADFWGFERNLIDNADATAQRGGWNSPAKFGSDLFAAGVYLFVMLCGVAGFVFAPLDRWKILFGAFTLYFLFAHLVIFGDGRFHLPLIPFFALYAAWFLLMFRRIVFSRARVGLTLLLVLVLASVWAREAWAALQVLRG